MKRELEIALRARSTWLVVGLAALLVGHGFLLALDLYTQVSRTALASRLQAREIDPLVGIVRPTLGGLHLAIALLVPLVATRPLSVEKERGTFGALCLSVGSIERVVLRKWFASFAAASLVLLAPLVMLCAFRIVGGHVDPIEVGVALLGEVLHLVLVVAISNAAAAWTRTQTQAVGVSVACSVSAWALDASDGFAALAWVGGAASWSIERHVLAFSRGVLPLGHAGWLLGAIACAVGVGIAGARFDLRTWRRFGVSLVVLAVGAVALPRISDHSRGYDWSEERRSSLPPDVVRRLRALDGPVALEVEMDLDDSRRRQLEADVLAKLRLARPDLEVRFPLDERVAFSPAGREDRYGTIRVSVAGTTRETRSTSRKELVTLLFDAARQPQPDYSAPSYPGYPLVVEGRARTATLLLAYGILPCAIVLSGIWITRRRHRR